MKRILWRLATFIVIIVFGTLGLSLRAAEQSPPTKIEGASDRIGAAADSGPLSPATAVVNPLKIDPKQPSRKYATKSARGYDLESVEVLARSVTFPGVIKQGHDMMSVDYPSDAILCLDAAYYAGRVQGLIWAMDRNTVEEHELYWIIDDAKELFDECQIILLQEAVQNTNHRIQVNGLQHELTEKIEMIQENLRKARHVKIKGAGLSDSGRLREGVTQRQEKLSGQQ